MALLEELKEKGHHGHVIQFGDGNYIYDRTDDVVYNAKTRHKLKWQKGGTKYVWICDGHGYKVRFRPSKLNIWKKKGVIFNGFSQT